MKTHQNNFLVLFFAVFMKGICVFLSFVTTLFYLHVWAHLY